jgi:hypothetical protein
MDKIIKEQVSLARKEEVLMIYEDLLRTIWDRILPTLGRVTVTAIVERALALTAEHYPAISYLDVTNEGFSFAQLREHVGEEERNVLRDSLKELVANLIDILVMLTGDILVQQLIKDIEGKRTA